MSVLSLASIGPKVACVTYCHAGKDEAGSDGGKTTVTVRGLACMHQDERKAFKTAAVERAVAASEIMREALRQFLKTED